MKDFVRFTFRIPQRLYDQIQTSADKNYRSLNAEIIFAIETYLSIHKISQNDQDERVE